MQKTDAELTDEANIIKDEIIANANSAERVGEMFVNIIDSKKNNNEYLSFIATIENMTLANSELNIIKNELGAYSFEAQQAGIYFLRFNELVNPFLKENVYWNLSKAVNYANIAGTYSVQIGVNLVETEGVYIIMFNSSGALESQAFKNATLEIRVYL